MSDEETMAEAAPADPSVGLATAMIALTTVMLLVAIFTTYKILGDHYGEGFLAK
jgi:hypothetical protein